MADNLAIAPGASYTTATDEISGVNYQRVKMTVGADGIAADQGTYSLSASFNRPSDTSAYAINDNVSNNTSAGSVVPLSFILSASSGIIRRVRVRKSNEAVATPTIRVWFFESSPTVGSGDNVTFAQPLAAAAGYVDVEVISVGSDDAVGWTNCDIPVVTGTCYVLLQTMTAFTPANAETFVVTIWYLNG